MTFRSKHRAHQEPNNNQLWYQDVRQLAICRPDLHTDMQGASCTRANVRTGGTFDRKSDKTGTWLSESVVLIVVGSDREKRWDWSEILEAITSQNTRRVN